MNSIDLTVTRETADDSRDYTITVFFEHDAYGIGLKLDPADAAIVGELTDSERDMAMEAVRERDGEE